MVQNETTRGISFMLAAVFCFSVMDACFKQLVTTYPPMQVAFFRGAAGLPLILTLSATPRNWRDLIPQRLGLHVMRGLLSVVTLYTFVYAVGELSLANAYSIFLVAPLVVSALSVPVLGEKVGWRRWSAIAIGLIGALVMLRPTGSGLITAGGLAALVSAIAYASGIVMIRIATRTDTAAATVFWTLLVLTIAAGLLSLTAWVPLQAQHWRWLLIIGVVGSLGQLALTHAFRLCAASVITPFEYTALLWGIAIDWIGWRVLPDERMLIGGAIVVGSGLYAIYRENREPQMS
jgi:drug/metabolite transporter (DMT)-like permease